MSRNIILVAGILIACALCAVIPAVSAAENPRVQVTAPAPVVTPAALQPATIQPVTEKTADPDPWYTPISELFGYHGQDTPQQGTDAAATTDSGNWWEKYFPVQQTKSVTPQETLNGNTNAVSQPQTPVKTPADGSITPQNPASTNNNNSNPKVNTEIPQTPKIP